MLQNFIKIGLIITGFFMFNSCAKKEIDLNKLESETIDPSFATSIGEVTLNLGRLEQHFDEDFFVYNTTTGLLEYISPKRLFEINLLDMFKLPTLNLQHTLSMPGSTRTTFNTGGAGTVVNFNNNLNYVFTMNNSEEVDSILIDNGSLNIQINSTYTHSGVVNLTIPSLTLNGNPLILNLPLNYTGPIPVNNTQNININGYTLDLSNNGVTFNTVNALIDIQFTSNGTPVTGAEDVSFDITFNTDSIKSAHGYFGSFSNIISQDTAYIDFFEKTNGTVHVAQPKIEFKIFNTSGIPFTSSFSGVYAPDNTTYTTLNGAGLSLDTLHQALAIGDTGKTYHVIDNSNTSPTLTNLIDEQPSKIIYDAVSNSNPFGKQNNFITRKSKVWCDSKLILPLDGWANGFTFHDTIDADLSELLNVDSTNSNRIETVTLRLISDNGLPVEAFVQVYFADSNGIILDSLFTATNGVEILRKANVNFSVSPSSPNYGRVISSVRKITDIQMSKSKFNSLKNSGAKKIIYDARANTNDASLLKDVKFYPEYNIKLKLSGKVDFNFVLN